MGRGKGKSQGDRQIDEGERKKKEEGREALFSVQDNGSSQNVWSCLG